jgi:hypothetical protein
VDLFHQRGPPPPSEIDFLASLRNRNQLFNVVRLGRASILKRADDPVDLVDRVILVR